MGREEKEEEEEEKLVMFNVCFMAFEWPIGWIVVLRFMFTHRLNNRFIYLWQRKSTRDMLLLLLVRFTARFKDHLPGH